MTRFKPLAKWSRPAFLVAGVFLIGFVGRNVIIAFGGGFSETMTALLYLAFVVPAEIAAYVGLLGLYTRVGDVTPKIAGAGAVFAGIAGVAMLGFAGTSIPPLLSSGSPDPPAVTQVLWLVALLTTILAFFLFASGILRSGAADRTLGLLLLIPPITYLVMIVSGVVGFTPEWSTVALSAIQAGSHLAIGLAIHRPSEEPDQRPSRSGTTSQ